MAVRGRRPTIAEHRARTRRRPPSFVGKLIATGRPECPKNFSKAHRALWDRFIAPAYWLAGVDTMKAIMFVNLAKQYADDPVMSVGRVRELRYLASDLALDPVSRARLVGTDEAANGLDQYK